ncbi:MAG: aminotransferase class I/II-fold pyridoxal phosphate-dependent enzyme [Oligoflexia bacterium]|nr:aminotransferase class I/II-fold pyridoxal phosphate-dependent enzyme [Oligoflexia bacterium]
MATKKITGLSSETKVLHQGYDPNLSVGSVISPIYPNSTYVFPSAKAGERAFELAFFPERALPGESPSLIYSRMNHPNAEILEDKLVQVEPGAGAAAVFGSGMSAIVTTVLALLNRGTGSHKKTVVYSNPVYGGSDYFFKHNLPTLGGKAVEIETWNHKKTKQLIESLGDEIGMLYLETPANPTLVMTDIDEVAKIAKKANPDCIVVVDNTFLGIFQQPFKIGQLVDVIVYSATKFMSGHAHLIAGVTMVREECKELIQAIKGWRTSFGTIANPQVCWELENSIKMYNLRMNSQAERATKVAKFLSRHPMIERVRHPSLLTEADVDYKIYQRQCTGPGSVITIDLKNPSKEYAFKFLDVLGRDNIIALAVSLGGVESLVEHPASMTHSEVSEQDRAIAQITDATIRFSIGLENPDDLISIISKAFDEIGCS